MATYPSCGRPRPNDWSSLRKELQATFSPGFKKAYHRGLTVSVCRAVKQARAETLQDAMRGAHVAEWEPEAAGDENYSAQSSIYSASTMFLQGDHGGNTFSAGLPITVESVRTVVIPTAITVERLAT